MTTSGNVHRAGTRLLSAVMVLIGVALIAQALSGTGGGWIARLLLGLLFVAGGAGRLYLLSRRRAAPGGQAP